MLQLPYPVILASASPRRKELLSQLVSNFQIIPANIDEDALTTQDPWKTAQGLAEHKGKAIQALNPKALVIAADTVVAYQKDGTYTQLAKPANEEEAIKMLGALSGRKHVVITGVWLGWPRGAEGWTTTTEVEFRELSPEEIKAYVATGEPMDKAGAYAIQGGAQGFCVSLTGSLSNVIGLPVEDLEKALASKIRT